MHEQHPVGLTITDDLERRRLTVFFRLLLVIPHAIWLFLWTIGVVVAAIIGWFAALFTGQLPAGIHRFICSYIRYSTHVYAYFLLVANPYPRFTGTDGYPVDITLPDAPERLSRWKVFFRIFLALPALALSAVLGGGFGFSSSLSTRSGNNSTSSGAQATGLAVATAFLGWFASMATGRMPSGLRDAGGYGLGYKAQAYAYFLLVTDRYPNTDPTALLTSVPRPPLHPVHLVGDSEDLRRSRVTVFFRLPLAIPHLVWLILWSILVWILSIVQWLVTLIAGRPWRPLHRFFSAWVRYAFHVYAFLFLVANPFPGFTGTFGTYPLDLVLPEAGRQNRWKTLFRGLLALPALVVAAALGTALFLNAVLTWFYALALGRAPEGLRNLSAFAIRYTGQFDAYYFFLTDRYPHASPLEGGEEAEEAVEAPTADAQAA
jgi:Domain of unknown function (DUF4389)